MTARSGSDAPPTVDAVELAELRLAMTRAEPNWPYVVAELSRHLDMILPLVAGTVQAADAEHELHDYSVQLDRWHRLADKYYAAFDKTIIK